MNNLNNMTSAMANINKVALGLSNMEHFAMSESLIKSAVRLTDGVSMGIHRFHQMGTSMALGIERYSAFYDRFSSGMEQAIINHNRISQMISPTILSLAYENQLYLQISKASLGLTKQIATLNKLYNSDTLVHAFDHAFNQINELQTSMSELAATITVRNPDYIEPNLLELLEDAIDESGILDKSKSQVQEVQEFLLEKIQFVYSYVIAKYPNASSYTLTALRSYFIGILISISIGTSSLITFTNNFNINIQNTSIITINNYTTKEIVKEIKQSVRAVPLDPHALVDYRFVSIESLAVWKSPKMSSSKIEDIPFGKMVRIVEKKRNWSLIEYMNTDGEYEYGWTHTRYLERFK